MDRRDLFGALALLLAAPAARACTSCADPSHRPELREARRDREAAPEPFDLRSGRPRVTEAELAALLRRPGTDGRAPRYALQEPGAILDSAAAPARAVTEPELLALLGELSGERAGRLRRRPGGPLAAAERAEVRELYFERLAYLAEADRRLVVELYGSRAGELPESARKREGREPVIAPAGAALDAPGLALPAGAPPRLAAAPPLPAPAARAPPASAWGARVRAWLDSAARLASEARSDAERANARSALAARLELIDGGDPAKRRALSEALDRSMRSATARDYAKRLVAELDAIERETGKALKIKVRFTDMDGSRLEERGGQVSFNGTNGFAWPKRVPPEVHLNPHFIPASPARVGLAKTFSHELFGHVLSELRMGRVKDPAEQANLREAWALYADDETQSRLVGWTVMAELIADARARGEALPQNTDAKLSDGYMWSYLQSPAQYAREIATGGESYAMWLTRAQMELPAAAYEARLASVRTDRRWYQDQLPKLARELRVLAHFSGPAHPERKPAEFAELKRTLERKRDITYPYWIKEYDAMEKRVTRLIADFSAPPGRTNARAESLRRGARHPHFDGIEAEMRELHGKLSALIGDRTEAGETAPVPWPAGQLTRAQLETLSQADLARHPGHRK